MRVLSAVAAAKGYTYRANQDFVIIKRGGQDARADGMALILPDESSRFRNGISDAVDIMISRRSVMAAQPAALPRSTPRLPGLSRDIGTPARGTSRHCQRRGPSLPVFPRGGQQGLHGSRRSGESCCPAGPDFPVDGAPAFFYPPVAFDDAIDERGIATLQNCAAPQDQVSRIAR